MSTNNHTPTKFMATPLLKVDTFNVHSSPAPLSA